MEEGKADRSADGGGGSGYLCVGQHFFPVPVRLGFYLYDLSC